MVRRRSPGYVRAWSDGTLHGVAWRLQRDFCAEALTPAQDWLLSCVLDELGYRRREAQRARGLLTACQCRLCRPEDDYTD